MVTITVVIKSINVDVQYNLWAKTVQLWVQCTLVLHALIVDTFRVSTISLIRSFNS